MECSLGISNFLEEISSLSHSVVFLYFFALIAEEGGSRVKASACNAGERCTFDPWVRKVPWRRKQQPTPVFLPGKPHGQRSLVSYSPWGHSESDRTELLHFHFSPSCIREGNGNPLQYSCLENPRDRGAGWAAVYGVAQSWTRLKRLSSSSSRESCILFFTLVV